MNAGVFSRTMHITKLLHPETLSDTELRKVLQTLCISVPADESRYNVIELYKKVAMPLPQRKSKNFKSVTLASGQREPDFNNSSLANLAAYAHKREKTWGISEMITDSKKIKLNYTCSNGEESIELIEDKLSSVQINNQTNNLWDFTNEDIANPGAENSTVETITRKRRALSMTPYIDCKLLKLMGVT